uniref:DUF1640 domain-containing protein n=1 Tax=Candidatus Kentrum sp. TC TaxID=2126339 RepID=A0A450Z8U9_9GAMM|nr:MAG: hypothetical protein BECKTC1821D_GA0114238_10944 [Candidatus Kentron sp. TC]
MPTTQFDTHNFVERLKSSGIPENQAVAHKDVMIEMDFATKADLAGMKTELKAELAHVKIEIITWIAGMFLGLVVIIVALVFGALPLVLK